jgi:hypothetical protein
MTTAPTMYTILFMSIPFTLAAAVPRSNRVTCPSRLRYPSWPALSVRQGTQRGRRVLPERDAAGSGGEHTCAHLRHAS